jgi:hypothetical protein
MSPGLKIGQRNPCNLQNLWIKLFSVICSVSNDLAFDKVNYLFSDVGGVIGEALQVSRNQQQIN